MQMIVLLALATVMYAGYNIFVNISGAHVPKDATSTVLATLFLQLTALIATSLFAAYLWEKGGHNFQLTPRAYLWAGLGGVCIAGAEVAYFYLFGGIGGERIQASIGIPFVVSGTILITMIVSFFVFREQLSPLQLAGCGAVIVGILMLAFGAQSQIGGHG